MTPAATPPDPPATVEVVVVKAARLPPAVGEDAYSSVSLGGEAIATAPRLDDLLTAVPGVQLFRRTSSQAANATTQGISVRSIAGSGASRALVLLDGVPLNDPFGGWVIWSGTPPIDVEQARVVRGAGTGAYGAGALTGTIELAERTTAPPGGERQAMGGSRGLAGGAFAAAVGEVFVSGGAERSDGWIPIRQGRGAADRPLYYRTQSLAARWAPQIAGADVAVRLAGYGDKRGGGTLGTDSRAVGSSLSLAMAHLGAGGTTWRLQGWVKHTDFENRSAAVSADRSTVTPANEQYATPTWGYGGAATLRHDRGGGGWEIGIDGRAADGETREDFRYMGSAFTRLRTAGGANLDVGAYGEAHREIGRWLLTGGVRLDRWATYGGHRLERDAATLATTLDERPADRGGWLPTGRVGVRARVGAQGYVRAASYAGFRPATLNELYRPFRVANDVTEANAALKPEKLYGVELGVGGEGALAWSATLFANRLDAAVTNVTLGVGPATFPIAGFIPAGGVLRQRQNVGDIQALGAELNASRRWDAFGLTLAANYTDAKVHGGQLAARLTGLRPAQTPRLTATAEGRWAVTPAVSLQAALRYEGLRFDDDLNTRRLPAAAEVSLRADWKVRPSTTLYAAVDNLFDADVATAQSGAGFTSYDAPRTVRAGVILR